MPLPFDNNTGRHAVFVKAYKKYVARLATWSRRHDVRLLHLSQYGQDWAELQPTGPRSAPPAATPNAAGSGRTAS